MREIYCSFEREVIKMTTNTTVNEVTTDVMENVALTEESRMDFGSGLLIGAGASLLSTFVIVPVIKKLGTKVKNAWETRKEKKNQTKEVTVLEVVEGEE